MADTKQFGKLAINPAVNPGILDTATWDPETAWTQIQAVGVDDWEALQAAATNETPPAPAADLTPYPSSFARHAGAFYCLAGLNDGQQVFLALGPGADSLLGVPIGSKALSENLRLAVYPTDALVIDRFCRLVKPEAGPKALGPVSRLGIGTRMTTAV